jgi:uncharacterized protein YozE (UPF0346 family)
LTLAWSFKTWISEFACVNLFVGEVARMIRDDPDFPKEDDVADIFAYMGQKYKFEISTMEHLANMWSFYRLSTRPIPADALYY